MMITVRSLSTTLVLALGIAAVPQPADAQRLLERVKRAATQIATEEVMQQADALLGDLATRVVDDGRFMAVAAPWASENGDAIESRASLGGTAHFERRGPGFGLVLCADSEPYRLVAGFVVGTSAAAIAQAANPVDPGAATSSRRGAAPAEPGAQEAEENPFVGEYPLSSPLVRGGAGGPHVRAQNEAEGMLRLTAISGDLLVGTASLTLPEAHVAQETDPRPVQVSLAFRAKPVRAGETPTGCRPPR
jgi:hypothetical protein